MSRKQLALLVTVLLVSFVTYMFAAETKPHLRTSGLLTGNCLGMVTTTGADSKVGAYVNGLGGSNLGPCFYDPFNPGLPAFVPMPSNGVLANLSVSVTTSVSAFSGGGSAVATVMLNGNATALTCTVPALSPAQTRL